MSRNWYFNKCIKLITINIKEKYNMASKFNSEFNYRYQVIGDTPWEKIKTLQGFLEGRIRAARSISTGREYSFTIEY
jgi:hypothetical protein